MAFSILSNKKNIGATIHTSAANVSLVVAGNNSVSNVATSTEILSGLSITSVAWGIDTGSIQLLRGANLIATFTQSGSLDYAALGCAISKDSGANLNVNFVGSSNGYLLVNTKKIGTFTSEYFQS